MRTSGDRQRLHQVVADLLDNLPRIWDRLYRADQSRSGLGLSFVRAIVEAHRGQKKVESELGVGSTFVIRLPVG